MICMSYGRMFPCGLDLYYTDPAQNLITAGLKDPDDLDHGPSDV